MKKAMLLKCALSLLVLNFASILTIANAGTPIATPMAAPVITPNIAPPTPSPVIVPPFPPIVTPTMAPLIGPPVIGAPLISAPILPPIAPAAPFVPFVPTTLPQIDFKAKSTTIQPLAAAYQLASAQAASTQAASTQATSTQAAPTQVASSQSSPSVQAASTPATSAQTPTQGISTPAQSTQINNSLASVLQKANEELDVKHKKEYDNVIKDNIELLKEKEKVLIQLHAQLKLQLEAQKFAAQQRARAIKQMQEKLKLEEEKSKKDAEEMKLNVQSIVDLSPLVLNINQPKEKEKDASHVSDFDFTNLKKSQRGAKNCKKRDDKTECSILSNYCMWGRVPKQKKHKCLFMCEKLSKKNCKKVTGCYFKDHKCRNK